MLSWRTVSRIDADGGLATAEPAREPLGREFGKYRLHRRIARGGMGEVYLARLVGELGFERDLVIKTILPELAAKPRFIEMFAAEAKTAVALSHGNIVPAYELGRTADTFYIAMGYVDGPSVAQLLEATEAQGKPPNIAAGLHVIRGVLAGLSYAHREEPGRPAVVHRDITPRNVLIDRSGQVRIVDFGIAAPARRQVGVRAGSIGYMAPEQARGDAADPRADVFSSGCLLYELCTHTRAFPKEGVWSTPDLSRVPDDVREPLERALAIDPDARFKDASEMNAALRASFANHAGTFDDAALARTIAKLFPKGWRRGEEARNGDSGEGPVLDGPNETYATRLTAVTGINPASLPPADPTETPAMGQLPVDLSDDNDDEREGEAPGERAVTAGSVTSATGAALEASPEATEDTKGGIRVSSLAMILGALAIGLAAFAIGRTDVRSSDEQPVAGRVASAQPETTPAVTTTTSPPASKPSPPLEPPPTAASTPAPVANVEQRLRVTPDGAMVEVDGERLPGKSPYVLSIPHAGTLEVRISARGHTPQTLTLSAKDLSDPSKPLQVDLEAVPVKVRDPGGLRVLAPTVAWAEVLVDGKKVGSTPTRRISVPSGRHKVEVRCVPDVCAPARTLYRQTITIEPGKTSRVDARG